MLLNVVEIAQFRYLCVFLYDFLSLLFIFVKAIQVRI